MASTTLTESAKLDLNKLLPGLIENIVTVDQVFQYLPFELLGGNALQYTRELTLGDVQTAAVGDTITAKNAATHTSVTTALTTIIGDSEVNGLIQNTRSNHADQTQIQVESKIKSAGRTYSNLLLNGDTGSDATQFDGLLTLLPAGQTVSATGSNGDTMSFEKMDEIMSLVKSKDGQVDAFIMNDREIRAYLRLLRSVGGAGIGEVISLPNGEQIPGYRGVPILRNDYMPITQTQGTATNASSILAVNFDDGSMRTGIAGVTSQNNMGLNVKYIGEHQSRDESIYRVTWYCSLALFSNLSIAGATGIIPS